MLKLNSKLKIDKVATFTMMLIVLGIVLVPALPAFAAFNIDTGTTNILNQVKKIIVIVVGAVAIGQFFKSRITQAVVIVFAGAFVYIALDIATMGSIGQGIMTLLGI